MAFQEKIEVERKCVDPRKQRENTFVKHENSSVPDKKDDKDKRANIISEKRDKR